MLARSALLAAIRDMPAAQRRAATTLLELFFVLGLPTTMVILVAATYHSAQSSHEDIVEDSQIN